MARDPGAKQILRCAQDDGATAEAEAEAEAHVEVIDQHQKNGDAAELVDTIDTRPTGAQIRACRERMPHILPCAGDDQIAGLNLAFHV